MMIGNETEREETNRCPVSLLCATSMRYNRRRRRRRRRRRKVSSFGKYKGEFLFSQLRYPQKPARNFEEIVILKQF